MRFRAEREEQDNGVGLGKQSGERLRRLGVGSGVPGDADDAHTERFEARGQRATDRAVPEDEDDCALEIVGRADR